MMTPNINIILADDDQADCVLFKDALEELPISAHLTIVHDGEQLIAELNKNKKQLPDVLFLDLNMPRKNGFLSLGEIKRNTDLQDIPVIIFSTASDMEKVKDVFRDAAHYYITKPADFSTIKKVIYEALTLIMQKKPMPNRDKFMITGEFTVIPDEK